MAKKHQPEFEALSAEAEAELFELRQIIGLAVFATESRRVLSEIEQLCEALPALDAQLSQLIDGRRHWTVRPDTVSAVLEDAYDRLGKLLGER